MEKQFIPYELALKLRDLGYGNKKLNFYWGCFAYYATDKTSFKGELIPNNTLTKHSRFDYSQFVNAPLWQQAFDWFREVHNLTLGIAVYNKTFVETGMAKPFEPIILKDDKCSWSGGFDNYDKTKLESLMKLIEIYESKNKS